MLSSKSRYTFISLILFISLISTLFTVVGKDRSFEHPLEDVEIMKGEVAEGVHGTFHRVKIGMEIPLHSFIELDRWGKEEGFLSIEFPKEAVSKKFIRDFFYGEDPNIVGNVHPFAYNGIEAILTKDKMILNLHRNVILHLRNDMSGSPDYKTFKSEDVVGKVVEVRGIVFCSFDTDAIKEHRKDFFIGWNTAPPPGDPRIQTFKSPDGKRTISIMPEPDDPFPPRFPPKVIEDGKERIYIKKNYKKKESSKHLFNLL